MRLTLLLTGAVLAALVSAHAAWAATIRIGVYSESADRAHATAGATITRTSHHAGQQPHKTTQPAGAQAAPATPQTNTGTAAGSAAASPAPPSYPALASGSPLLQDAHPGGPGTFWYQDGAGDECIYIPGTSPACYLITAPAAAATPAIDPAAVASSLAGRLDLSAGNLDASPAGEGLTGTASWFWLDPGPAAATRTITLAGETVTVSATPTVEWQFGDGATLKGGSGIPYQAGSVPSNAVTHVYQTRCLPGDVGQNPYVLPSCGSNGYPVAALVTWQLTYQATGPVTDAGTLTSRTTESDLAYPVTEVRAFLDGAGT